MLHFFRRYDNGQSPNVKKAKDLVEDLSHIKDQVKYLVEVSVFWYKLFCYHMFCQICKIWQTG